jgi:hypothetical protein
LPGEGQIAGNVPPGAVNDNDGMGARRNGLADFDQMKVHCFCIDIGHEQRRSHIARRTDSAKNVGVSSRRERAEKERGYRYLALSPCGRGRRSGAEPGEGAITTNVAVIVRSRLSASDGAEILLTIRARKEVLS